MSKSNDNQTTAEPTTTPAAGEGAPAPRRRRRFAVAQGMADGLKVGRASTLGDVLYARCVDLGDMAQVGTYIAVWGRFVEDNGREPQSVVELAAWFGEKPSRPTLARYQARFRRAFPEYSTPAVLWSIARSQVPGDNASVVSTQIGAVVL